MHFTPVLHEPGVPKSRIHLVQYVREEAFNIIPGEQSSHPVGDPAILLLIQTCQSVHLYLVPPIHSLSRTPQVPITEALLDCAAQISLNLSCLHGQFGFRFLWSASQFYLSICFFISKFVLLSSLLFSLYLWAPVLKQSHLMLLEWGFRSELWWTLSSIYHLFLSWLAYILFLYRTTFTTALISEPFQP